MPLLARMVAFPLAVDVRSGAVAGLGALLSDRLISAHGDVARPTFPRKSTNCGPSVITSIAVVSAASFAIA